MNIELVKSKKEGRKYKIYNGTAYDEKTSDAVILVLDKYLQGRRDQRIRIFYGDTATGRDWNEEHQVIGYIGLSTGMFKIPLMIANANSSGGPALLDHCIVKITVDKSTVYKHPNYQANDFMIEDIGEDEAGLYSKGYRSKVIRDGKDLMACFITAEKAANYVSFMKGERNKVA